MTRPLRRDLTPHHILSAIRSLMAETDGAVLRAVRRDDVDALRKVIALIDGLVESLNSLDDHELQNDGKSDCA